MKPILIFLSLLSVVGCNNKAVYDNIQYNKRTDCLKVPASEYEQCMEGVDRSYEEYERQRKAVIDG